MLLQLRRGVDHRRLGVRTRRPLRTLHPTSGWRPATPMPATATRTASARRNRTRPAAGRPSALAVCGPVREGVSVLRFGTLASMRHHVRDVVGGSRTTVGRGCGLNRTRSTCGRGSPDLRSGRGQVRQRREPGKQPMAAAIAPHGRRAAGPDRVASGTRRALPGNLEHGAPADVCSWNTHLGRGRSRRIRRPGTDADYLGLLAAPPGGRVADIGWPRPAAIPPPARIRAEISSGPSIGAASSGSEIEPDAQPARRGPQARRTGGRPSSPTSPARTRFAAARWYTAAPWC